MRLALRYETIKKATSEMRTGCNLKNAHRVLKTLLNHKKGNGFPDFINHNGQRLTKEGETQRRI
jgi:hypothetical protein